jgi:hypothetical protein
LVFKEHIHLVNYGWPLAFWFTVSSLLNVSDRYIIGYLNAVSWGLILLFMTYYTKELHCSIRPFWWLAILLWLKKYNQGNKKVHFNFKEVDSI